MSNYRVSALFSNILKCIHSDKCYSSSYFSEKWIALYSLWNILIDNISGVYNNILNNCFAF